MAAIKSWIEAARPRTLPLALAGIIMGCGLSAFFGRLSAAVSILSAVTAIFIQIFSNFANDYGDSIKGTDNTMRKGPARTVQKGDITPKEMVGGMIIVGAAASLSGIMLIYKSVWHVSPEIFFIFMGLGLLSLSAAYFYTSGKAAYGYMGFGDLAVFIFFGLLPVGGVFFLNTLTFEIYIIYPAISIGLFSTGVLNLNNMRDIDNDRRSGKITLAVRLGKRNSLIYHSFLVGVGWVAAIIFTTRTLLSPWQWLFVLALPFFMTDVIHIYAIRDEGKLDPFLKRLSLSTLAFTVLFCAGLIIASR